MKRALMLALVLLGVALRVWAYAADTSLWLDEILLSRNILGLPLRDLLTRPLQLDQVAPRGFLLVEKVAVLAFGRSELVLRLFPFLCGIAGLLLFWRVSERMLDGAAPALALALFAIGVPFIRYGAEVKQYVVDATAAVLLTLLALQAREPGASRRRLIVVGLAGFVVSWFSQASVIVMAGIGAAFAIEWLVRRDRETARPLLITIPLWASASLITIVAGLRSMTPSTRAFMDDFWRLGFLPMPFRPASAVRWLWDQGLSMFTDPTLLRYPLPALFLVLAPLGLFALWRRRRHAALFIVCPVMVALAAAVAHQYPFSGRLMFYLFPGLLLAIAEGVEWIRAQASRLSPALGWALACALLVPPVAALAKGLPPYEREHHRTILAYLQQHRQPGDVVYVLPLSRIGTLYYGPRFGLQPSDWVTATCDRFETRPYIRDVDRFRGVPRLWLLSSGARAYRFARATLQSYLGTIGVKRDSLTLPSQTMGNVSLELYDLSDAKRLTAADAATFPAPPMANDPRTGCRAFTQPGPLDQVP
jgi:hypothetical protein